MSNFPPGPWQWVGESYQDASGSQEDVVVICTTEGETVAVIHESYNPDVAATARLIAAAPDLHAALSACAQALGTVMDASQLARLRKLVMDALERAG